MNMDIKGEILIIPSFVYSKWQIYANRDLFKRQ